MSAGYSRVMIVAVRERNAWGYDEIVPQLLLLIGEGNRQWIEARHFWGEPDGEPHPRVLIPEGPDCPDMLFDACLAFMPEYFASCPSYTEVKPFLATATGLDFNMDHENIPSAWDKWREEARPLFSELLIHIDHIDTFSEFVTAAELEHFTR